MLLDFAKLVHEAIGIESPRTFIFVFALVGFLVFGGIGWLIDKGYRVRLQQEFAHAKTVNPSAPPTEQPTPPTSHSEPTAVVPSTAKKANKRSETKAETPKVNVGPNSVVSVNQQGGITAATVNVGPPPPKITCVKTQDAKLYGDTYRTVFSIDASRRVDSLIVRVEAPTIIDARATAPVAILSISRSQRGNGFRSFEIDNASGMYTLLVTTAENEDVLVRCDYR